MSFLSVSNAKIYYELYPSSPAPHLPLLLLIHGGNGELNYFRPVASVLEKHFRVCIYDRRGFSRSPLTGPQDYSSGEARLNTDADDARALIEHLNQNTSETEGGAKSLPGAVVLGNSSGAIVALHVLTRHPDAVTKLVAHEPPMTTLLPDREAWAARQQSIYDIYRQQGHVAAMGEFFKMVRADSDPGFVAPTEHNPYAVGNIIYWFEREVLPYVHSELDFDALEKVKDKLVLVNGKTTNLETPQYLCNVELGKRLGLEVKMFEGGHIAFKVDPGAFAKDLRAALDS